MYRLNELTDLLPKLTLFAIKPGDEPQEARAWRIWMFTKNYADVTMTDILKREEHALFGPNHVPETHGLFQLENMVLTTIQKNIERNVIETAYSPIESMLKEYRGLYQRLLYLRSLPDVDLGVLSEEGRILNKIDELNKEFSEIHLKYEGELPERILEPIAEKAAWLHLGEYVQLVASRYETIGYSLNTAREIFKESKQEYPELMPETKIENVISVNQIAADSIEKGILMPEISKNEALNFLSDLSGVLTKLTNTPVDRFYLFDMFGKSAFRHSERFKKTNKVNYVVVDGKICKDRLSL